MSNTVHRLPVESVDPTTPPSSIIPSPTSCR